MPIKDSAKKSLRQTKKRTIRNLKRKTAVKDLFKKAVKAAEQGQVETIKELLRQTQKAIDKAAKVGAIKKNAANRKKSRLAKKLKKLTKKG